MSDSNDFWTVVAEAVVVAVATAVAVKLVDKAFDWCQDESTQG